MGLGGQELLIILLIVLVLFGAKKIPELMKGLGSGIRNFKKEMGKDEEEELAGAKPEEINKATSSTTQNSEAKPQETKV